MKDINTANKIEKAELSLEQISQYNTSLIREMPETTPSYFLDLCMDRITTKLKCASKFDDFKYRKITEKLIERLYKKANDNY